jgi:hypothetical protein
MPYLHSKILYRKPATFLLFCCATFAHAQSTHTAWYDRPAEFLQKIKLP